MMAKACGVGGPAGSTRRGHTGPAGLLLSLLSLSLGLCSCAQPSSSYERDSSAESDSGVEPDSGAVPDSKTVTQEDLAAQLLKLTTPAGLTSGAASPLAEEPAAASEPTTEPPTETVENGRPVRTTITLTRYTASAKYDTQLLLNPSTDVIYPGSVLVGSSIEDGSYREVTRGVKNDLTVSYGGLNGVSGKDGKPGVVSGTIQPSLSAFRTFHNQVMSQTLNGSSSTYALQVTDASTSDSFDVHFAAGVSFKAPAVSASIKANFDYTKKSAKNKYMIRFAQTFYTVDIDHGSNNFLYRSYELDQFQGYRPVYVSSVAYGRLAFITLESTERKETIAAGIGAIIKAPSLALDVSASADTAVQAIRNSSNLNITVIGSNQVVTTLAGLKDFIENGGFSAANTGQIVSYKLRFVDNNAVANVVYNGEYTLRSTSQTTGAWDVAVQADGILFADTDGSRKKDMVDLMGRLVLHYGADEYTLWQRPRSGLGIYPDDALSFTDIAGETEEKQFTASSLSDALTFKTVDVYDYNDNNKSVLYGPADESFTIQRARTDDNHVVITAHRGDGQANKYVQFRVRVEAKPSY
jgi:hypothetical protein